MSQILKKYGLMFPLNIQLFAAEGGADATGGNGNPAGEGTGESGEGANKPSNNETAKTLAELLKSDSTLQSQFDKTVAKSIETAKTNWEADIDKRIAGHLTEAERLKSMTAEQKADYERQQKEDSLAKREMEISKRELMAEAKVTLVEKGLPASLSELLNYESADTVNTSIDVLKTAFEDAVKVRVADAIKSNTIPGKGSEANDDDARADKYRRIAGIQSKK